MTNADIVEFITARLDEREAVARACTPGPWGFDGDGDDEVYSKRDGEHGDRYADTVAYVRGRGGEAEANGAHMALNNPAWVLADIAAKRRILDRHGPDQWRWNHQPNAFELPDSFKGPLTEFCETCSTTSGEGLDNFYEPWPCDTVKDLAAPFGEHSNYKPAWRMQ